MWQSMISYLLAIYSYYVKHSSIVYSKFFEKQRFGEREGMKIFFCQIMKYKVSKLLPKHCKHKRQFFYQLGHPVKICLYY